MRMIVVSKGIPRLRLDSGYGFARNDRKRMVVAGGVTVLRLYKGHYYMIRSVLGRAIGCCITSSSFLMMFSPMTHFSKS